MTVQTPVCQRGTPPEHRLTDDGCCQWCGEGAVAIREEHIHALKEMRQTLVILSATGYAFPHYQASRLQSALRDSLASLDTYLAELLLERELDA